MSIALKKTQGFNVSENELMILRIWAEKVIKSSSPAYITDNEIMSLTTIYITVGIETIMYSENVAMGNFMLTFMKALVAFRLDNINECSEGGRACWVFMKRL